jgi:hypothetical protein
MYKGERNYRLESQEFDKLTYQKVKLGNLP